MIAEETKARCDRLVQMFDCSDAKLIVAPDINGQLLIMEEVGGVAANVYGLRYLVSLAKEYKTKQILEEAKKELKMGVWAELRVNLSNIELRLEQLEAKTAIKKRKRK